MKLLLFSLLFVFISKCGSEVVEIVPCYSDRKAISEIDSADLECSRTGELNILVSKESNKHFSICNSKEFPMLVGETYNVSGIIYEMKPNERWPGAPLQITAAQKQ